MPELGFAKRWEKMFRRHVTARMREGGLSRAEAKLGATLAIEEIRKIAAIRFNPPPHFS